MVFKCPLGRLTTGYGDQTALIIKRLKDAGHEPGIHAFWGLEGGLLGWNGVPVFPKGHMPYGQDIAAAHAVQFGAKYVFTLIDAWVYNNSPFFDMIAKNKLRWIPYMPIDSEPMPVFVRLAVEQAYKRIVYSEFAAKEMERAGMDYHYIPHCVDTNLLQPQDKLESRAVLRENKVDLPDNAFVIGMVAANKGNPSRKAFTQQIEAFTQFKKRHTDAVFYIHTSDGEHGEYQGVNLPEFCAFHGLKVGTDVFFPNDYNYFMGYPKQYLAHVYSAMDVHLLASTGEGFGIPIVEAQACGVPVIVGDWTSMSELCFSGWKIPKSEADGIWTPVAAYQYAPRVGAIVDALEQAYRQKDNKQYGINARIGALPYDADTIVNRYWLPFLDMLQKEDDAAADEIKNARQTAGKRVNVGE